MAKFNWKSSGLGALTGAVSSAIPGVRNFSPLLSAGAGALANKTNRVQGTLEGFGGGLAGSTAMGGLQNALGTSGGSALSKFSTGSGNNWRQYLGAIPGMGGFGTSNPTGALAKFTTMQPKSAAGTVASTQSQSALRSSSALPGMSMAQSGPASSLQSSGALMSMAPAATTQTPPMSMAPTTASTAQTPSVTLEPLTVYNQPSANAYQPLSYDSISANAGGYNFPSLAPVQAPTTNAQGNLPWYSNMLKSAPGMLTGAGITALGNFVAPEPETPDYSALASRYQSALTSGADPEAYAAAKRVLLGAADGSGSTSIGQQLDQSIAEQVADYDKQWKAASYGADYTNNSAYITGRTKLIADLQLQKNAYLENLKMDAATQLLNLNNSQLSYLSSLSDLEREQALLEYAAAKEKSEQLASIFSTIGGQVINQAVNQRA